MGGKKRRGGVGEKGEVAKGETHNQLSSYEAERTAMLEENKRRMMELGLLDASNLLATVSPRKKANRSLAQSGASHRPSRAAHNPQPPGPPRRSSRLRGTAVCYYEQVDDTAEGKKKRPAHLEWAKPEIYTEEDEKKLGSYEKPWELFVDGCDASGSRMYDSASGKTCHQCRQKTLGHRTSCSSCNALQGQFCGDCLFMRYGENVLETLTNKKWVCPICRGICNCSLCRPKRGWPPTGSMYRKAIALGYKSVAHYLILTRRAISVS